MSKLLNVRARVEEVKKLFRYDSCVQFRVTVGPIQFNASASQIRNNVGDKYNAGSALNQALLALEAIANAQPQVQSIVGRWLNTNISIERVHPTVTH